MLQPGSPLNVMVTSNTFPCFRGEKEPLKVQPVLELPEIAPLVDTITVTVAIHLSTYCPNASPIRSFEFQSLHCCLMPLLWNPFFRQVCSFTSMGIEKEREAKTCLSGLPIEG